EVTGEVRLDVERREAEHQDEARQHEAEASEEPAPFAPAVAAEVDAELVCLGAGEHLIDREQALEVGLADPPFLIDALALDHRYLRRRPSPGEAAKLEEAHEDRAEGFGALDYGGLVLHGGIVTSSRRCLHRRRG